MNTFDEIEQDMFASASLPPLDPAVASETELPSGQRNVVMIVDDNPEVASSLMQLLGDKYELIACSSYAAVEKTFDERVDLVLLDIKMAPVDGIVIYGLVRSRNPSVHILLHTAYPGDASVVRTMGTLEVDGWLTKGDYSLRDLENAIEGTLRNSSAHKAKA